MLFEHGEQPLGCNSITVWDSEATTNTYVTEICVTNKLKKTLHIYKAASIEAQASVTSVLDCMYRANSRESTLLANLCYFQVRDFVLLKKVA